jgi:hypothetical protein
MSESFDRGPRGRLGSSVVLIARRRRYDESRVFWRYPSIHSDLIAAINFVEQSSSPTITTPYTASSVEPGPRLVRPPALAESESPIAAQSRPSEAACVTIPADPF